MSRAHSNKTFNGFTIIELIVVITVIGILAGIVVVTYSGWRTNTAKSEVSSDLNSVSAAMESARNFSAGYPSTLPSSFTASPNVSVSLVRSTLTTYCAQATSTAVPSVVYYISSSNKVPTPGTC